MYTRVHNATGEPGPIAEHLRLRQPRARRLDPNVFTQLSPHPRTTQLSPLLSTLSPDLSIRRRICMECIRMESTVSPLRSLPLLPPPHVRVRVLESPLPAENTRDVTRVLENWFVGNDGVSFAPSPPGSMRDDAAMS